MGDKLGDMLLQAKIINEKQLSSALEYQKSLGGKLGLILVKLNFVKENEFVKFLSEQQKVPVVSNLTERKIDPYLKVLVPREFADKHEILPLERVANTLTIVTADLADYPAIDELAFTTGMKIITCLATRSDISKGMTKLYDGVSVPVKAEPKARSVTQTTAAIASKRGRGAHVYGSRETVQLPLEPKKLEIDTDKLVRALSGLLVEKNVIELNELMDRVARDTQGD
jgi:MshEN domain